MGRKPAINLGQKIQKFPVNRAIPFEGISKGITVLRLPLPHISDQREGERIGILPLEGLDGWAATLAVWPATERRGSGVVV